MAFAVIKLCGECVDTARVAVCSVDCVYRPKDAGGA